MDIKNTTLDDLSAVVGFSATLRLAAWYGDRNNLYIPNAATVGSVLVNLIGMSAATRLCKEFGGTSMTLPSLKVYETDMRRRLIGRMLERGFGTREIASFLQITERRVQQIGRELEVAGLIEVVLPQKASGKKQG